MFTAMHLKKKKEKKAVDVGFFEEPEDTKKNFSVLY